MNVVGNKQSNWRHSVALLDLDFLHEVVQNARLGQYSDAIQNQIGVWTFSVQFSDGIAKLHQICLVKWRSENRPFKIASKIVPTIQTK